MKHPVIEPNILEELTKVPWFSNCGIKTKENFEFDVAWVDNWARAQKLFTGTRWEWITQEAKG